MKKGKANILIVDSEESIRSSISEKLQSDGYSCAVAADSEQALETASTQDFDVIVLDEDIPGLSRMEALPQIITDHPNTCILITTSTADTQTAVEAMQLGAADYIAKPLDPDELERRVKKALDRKKTRLNESHDALKESENKFKILSEAMSDGYFVVQDSVVIFYNEKSADMLGYTQQEMLGKSIQDILSPEVMKDLAKIHKRRLSGESTPTAYETSLPRKDGTSCPVELSVRLMDHEGKPAVSAILRDISERKAAEESVQQSESLYRLLAENVTDVIFTLNMKGQLTYVSPSITAQRGYTVEEALTQTIEEMVTADSIEILRQGFYEALANQDSSQANVFNSQTLKMELNCKDGSTIWTESAVSYLRDSNGKAIGILGVTRSIAGRREAEEALQQSEALYRLLAENVTDVIWIMDMNLQLTYVSPSTTKMRGYTPEESITQSMEEYLTPASLEANANMFVEQLILETQENSDPDRSWTTETEVYCRDGSTKWVEMKMSFLHDQEGQAIGILGTTCDITDRKAKDDELQRSEAYFRSLIENAQDGIAVINRDGGFKYESNAMQRILGYDPENRFGRSQFDNLYPDDLEKAANLFDQLIKNPDSIIHTEIRAYHEDGSLRTFEVIGRNCLDDPAVDGIVANFSDITERKQAEGKLQDQERLFRSLIENSFDAVSILNIDGSTRYQSPIMQRLLGYDPEENTDQSALEFVHPDDLPKCADLFEKLIGEPGSSVQTELRIQHANGSWIICEIMGKNLIDDPIVQGILTNLSDITERKQAEEALAEAEERFRLLAENATDTIWTRDLDLRPTYISPAVEKMRGFTVEEAMVQTPEETMPPESAELATSMLINELARLKSGQRDPAEIATVELEAYCKDGSTIWTEVKVNFLQDKDGIPVGVLGITRDISERRQAADALRESEERLRVITDNISDVIAFSDASLNMTYVTPSIAQLHGYTQEEAMNSSLAESMTPKSFQKLLETITKDLSIIGIGGELPKKSSLIEVDSYRKDGSIVPVEMVITFVWGPNSELAGYITVMRDITERKEAELALRESEERLRLITDNISDVIVVCDSNLNVTYVSPSIEPLRGFTPEEVLSMSVEQAYTPESYQYMMETIINDIYHVGTGGERPKKSSLMEVDLLHKDGSIIPVETVHTFVWGDNGEISYYVATTRDVSERKKAEQDLRESEERLRLVTDNISDVIVVSDTNLETQYVSPSITQLRGCTVEEAMLLKMEDGMTPESYQAMMEQITRDLSDYINGVGKPQTSSLIEADIYNKNGFIVPVEMVHTFVYGVDDNIINYVTTMRDITERKQAEEALKKSEEYFRVLTQSISDIIIVLNSDLSIRYKSPAFDSMAATDSGGNTLYESSSSQQQRQELVEETLDSTAQDSSSNNTNTFNFIHPDDVPMASEVFSKLMEKPSEPISLEIRGHYHEGSWDYYEIVATNLLDNPSIEGILVTFRDITDRKAAEEATYEAERRYRAIFDNRLQMVYIHNEEGKFLDANDFALEKMGFSREDLLSGKLLFQEIIHPDDIEKAYGEVANIMVTGGMENSLEIRLQPKQGETVWIDTFAIPLSISQEHYIGLGLASDITERKRAEQELQNRTNHILALQEVTSSLQSTLNLTDILQRVADSIVHNLDFEHAFIFILDEEDNIQRGTTYSTRGGVELVGGVQEIISQALTQIEIPNIKGYSLGMDIMLSGQTHITNSLSDIAMPPFTKEECDSIQDLVAAKTWVNMPIHANNKLLGALMAFTSKDDVTQNEIEPLELLADRAGVAIENARLFQEIKTRAEELWQSKEEIRTLNEDLEQRVINRTSQLEAANKELESFAYSVSHDLRAPLRSIDGFSNLLLEDYNDVLDDQGKDYLNRVSSSTRRMTQLIDGILDLSRLTRGELNSQEVHLSDMVESILEELKQQQPDRQVEFTITPDLVANGDVRLLRATFENLLGNAWKFTSKCESAKIEFGCDQINNRTIYYIRDNGAGFDMANIDRLFGTFQRLHTLEEFEGTGIGLATVQRIIRRHNGDVWAESEVNKGATFYFTLE